ncbi:MAG: tRNA-(ms[2]io[6]A)-hydroxylase [Gammaproteobacteria bacterium]|nr:tRNA-(ms[2]io[6]A)-hydroxylase [Gammaproteobacteria bacterium]MDH3768639.1 tRNA-(ms[2]io[6]A)-hydroxylase [Gammaproteobacteria bacterium]
MTRKSIDLLVATAPSWVEAPLGDFDKFMMDHANCERKASALAMSLVMKYADRQAIIPGLIDLALEELEHFRQVYELMQARGLTLASDVPDPYVKKLVKLMRHTRDERFIDQLLVASIIECRGAERFGLIAAALTDPGLKAFYTELHKAEKKHGHLFVHLLLRECPEELVYPRCEELMQEEARIVQTLPWRAALH